MMAISKVKLTVKQEKFCQGLMLGKTQRQAYKEAYNCENMSDNAIDREACLLAKNPKIVQRLEELNNMALNRTMLTIDRVVEEYSKLAFFDPREFFRDDGTLKDISELEDDAAAAIAGMDVAELFEGFGEDREKVGVLKKVKLADKTKALDSLAKFLGMFVERKALEIAGKDGQKFEVNIKVVE